MLPVFAIFGFLLIYGGTLGAIFCVLFGIGMLVAIGPWIFVWYSICFALMAGDTEMALRKEEELTARLTFLRVE